jgi:hypothetical protein
MAGYFALHTLVHTGQRKTQSGALIPPIGTVIPPTYTNHGKLWKSLMRAHLGNYEHLEIQLKNIALRSSIALTA